MTKHRYFSHVILQGISQFVELRDIISNFRVLSFCFGTMFKKGNQTNQENNFKHELNITNK